MYFVSLNNFNIDKLEISHEFDSFNIIKFNLNYYYDVNIKEKCVINIPWSGNYIQDKKINKLFISEKNIYYNEITNLHSKVNFKILEYFKNLKKNLCDKKYISENFNLNTDFSLKNFKNQFTLDNKTNITEILSLKNIQNNLNYENIKITNIKDCDIYYIINPMIIFNFNSNISTITLKNLIINLNIKYSIMNEKYIKKKLIQENQVSEVYDIEKNISI